MTTEAANWADTATALAAQAEQLATATKELLAAMRASTDAPTRSAAYRLDEVASQADEVRRELLATAADLRHITLRVDGICRAEYGCCPAHGLTLVGSGDKSWCTAPGCGNSWPYDRDRRPCTEPVAVEIVGPEDDPTGWARVCRGHGFGAARSGFRVRPLNGQ